MASTENTQVSIPEEYREQGRTLSDEFQAEGLGTISHGSIYLAGLEAKRALLENVRAMKGKPAHAA